MGKLLALLVVSLTVRCCFAVDYLHTVVLIGQSNAVGQAGSTGGNDVEGVSLYNNYGQTNVAVASKVTTSNGLGRMGPEHALAGRLKEAYPNSNLAIIKFASGGTTLEWEWDPDPTDDSHPKLDFQGANNEGVMFTGMTSALDDAITKLETSTSKTVGLAAVSWIQGEHDGLRKHAEEFLPQSPPTGGSKSQKFLATPGGSSAANYEDNLEMFIDDTLAEIASRNPTDYATTVRFHYSTLSSTIDAATQEYEFSDVGQVRTAQINTSSHANVDMIDVDLLFAGESASQIFLDQGEEFNQYDNNEILIGCNVYVNLLIHYNGSHLNSLGAEFANRIRLPGDVDGTQGYGNGDAAQLVDLDGDGDTDGADLDRLFDYAGTTKAEVGDLTLDGVVLFADFLILSSNFGKQSGAIWAEGDLNSDGKVTFPDFLILAANYDGAQSEIAGGP